MQKKKEVDRKPKTQNCDESDKFKEIIDRISDPIIATDNNWCYTFVNKKAEQILGSSAAFLLGKNIWTQLPEINSLQLKASCAKAMETQEYVYYEQYSDVHNSWFGNHIYPSSEGITITFRNITKRKRREEDYNKLADRNALILDTMLDNFALTDKDLNFIDVNPSFCKTTGYSRNELLKMNFEDLAVGLSRKQIKKIFRDAIKKGNVLLDTKKQRKNGEIIDLELTVTEMQIDGRTYFASFGRDISDYKMAEAQLKNEKNLSDSLINSLPGLFYLFDKNGKFLRWNKNVEKISGLSHEEVASIHPLDLFGREDQLIIKRAIKEVFDNGRAEVEAKFDTKEYGRIPFYFNGSSTEIKGEKCLIGTAIDITQLTQAKEALHQMEQKAMGRKVLEQKKISRAIINAQEKERTYIGRELHDNVNQLLASTRIYLGIATKDNDRTKQLLKYPMELLDNSIAEIRSLSHQHVAPLQNVDLKQLVIGLLNLLEKSAVIKTKFEYDIHGKFSDDDLKLNIYRIVQEQVNNIIKHSEATKVNIVIKNCSKNVNIVMKDNGKGFDITKGRQGIGISNIINRINSFNGEMAIKSAPGKGCELKIKIPY
ncbi:MAG TPA: PAS domain S-box protein [Hanamia sp.]